VTESPHESPLDSPLVEARGLTKIYPPRGSAAEFRAVDDIDFELRRGEAFGFLGPNGAGKSSTMRMISAISPISGGIPAGAGHGPGDARCQDPGPARRGTAG